LRCGKWVPDGDKVKVICNNTKSPIVQKTMNEIGVISSVKSVQSINRINMIYVQFDKDMWQGLSVIGFWENEIEKVVTKGEQLMLFEI